MCSSDLGAIAGHLDRAPLIYTFNGVTFDIPFLQRSFAYSNQQVGSWMKKVVDPLYSARALLGMEACRKLNDILILNGLPGKTAKGSDAIGMGREELVAYCAHDTRMTFDLLEMSSVHWIYDLSYSCKSGLWKRAA